jgi:hypothetical protein
MQMPTDERSTRTRLNLPVAGRRLLEFEPLAHVLFALALSGASLLMAVWTLWPSSEQQGGTSFVHAAETHAAELEAPWNASLSLAEVHQSPRIEAQDPLPWASPLDSASPALRLRGTVVDEFWRPIPYAALWVDRSPWKQWAVSDAFGVFDVKVPKKWVEQLQSTTNSLRIAARSARYAPSRILSLSQVPSTSLQLVLAERGASLNLEFTDETGSPLQGVRVRLDSVPGADCSALERQLESKRMPAPPTVSDNWGLARLEGLAPGPQEVVFERAGFSRRQGRITLLPGDVSTRIIVMKRSASLQGHLVRADGGPLQQSLVRATCEETLEVFETHTDHSGHYVLSDLPAGSIQLFARGPERVLLRVEARTRRELSGGQIEHWSPTLYRVQRISGQLLASSDRPLEGWRVEVRDADAAGESTSSLTDANGAYELPAGNPSGMRFISFFHPDAGRGIPTRSQSLQGRDGHVDDVELEEDETHVSRLTGRVLNPFGHAAAGVHLVLHRSLGRDFVQVDVDDDGRFGTPPIPPGLYIPVFSQHGMGWTPDNPIRMEGIEEFDIGTLQLPLQGRLSVMTSTADRYSEQRELALDLLRPGISPEFRLPIFRGSLEAPVEIVLAPGDYELSFPGILAPPVVVHIESGECTVYTLPTLD